MIIYDNVSIPNNLSLSVVIISSHFKLRIVARLETIKYSVLILSSHVNILTSIVVASNNTLIIASSHVKLLKVAKLETFRYSVLILLF